MEEKDDNYSCVHKIKKTYRNYIIGFIISQIMIWILFLSISMNCTNQCWNTWFSGYFTKSGEVQDILKNHPYCENEGISSMDDFILTRSNSLSNYIYVMFGSLDITLAIFCYRNVDDKLFSHNHLRRNPLWLIGHGLILIYGGMTSFAFHASFTNMGYLLDISSVFSMLSYPVAFSLLSIFIDELPTNMLKVLTNVLAIFVFFLALVAGVGIVYFNNALEKNEDFAKNILIAMAIIFIASVLLKIWIQKVVQKKTKFKLNYWIMALAVVSILVALPCQETFVKNLPCDPEAILQLHSFWHLFSGIALFLTMMVYFFEVEHSVENSIEYTIQLNDMENPTIDADGQKQE